MMEPSLVERRAVFDAVITFVNGGNLRTEGFRLDLPYGATEADVPRLLVQHLGLALVGTRSSSRTSRDRGGGAPRLAGNRDRRPDGGSSRVVDLSHVIREGLDDLPGPARRRRSRRTSRARTRVRRYAPGTEFAMDIITMIGNTGTYLDSPWHRYADGTDLAGLDLAALVELAGRGLPPHRRHHPRHPGRGVLGPRRRGQGCVAPHRLGPPLRNARVRDGLFPS